MICKYTKSNGFECLWTDAVITVMCLTNWSTYHQPCESLRLLRMLFIIPIHFTLTSYQWTGVHVFEHCATVLVFCCFYLNVIAGCCCKKSGRAHSLFTNIKRWCGETSVYCLCGVRLILYVKLNNIWRT